MEEATRHIDVADCFGGLDTQFQKLPIFLPLRRQTSITWPPPWTKLVAPRTSAFPGNAQIGRPPPASCRWDQFVASPLPRMRTFFHAMDSNEDLLPCYRQ
jgi:hypothetical protein